MFLLHICGLMSRKATKQEINYIKKNSNQSKKHVIASNANELWNQHTGTNKELYNLNFERALNIINKKEVVLVEKQEALQREREERDTNKKFTARNK